jgi:hypothetical protein
MAFRFRRSTRLGPFRFHFSKAGLSSISLGGRGASYNIPVGRSGAARATVGLPGTGLSWSVEEAQAPAAGLPNSRRLRPGQLDALKQSLLAVLLEQLAAPGCIGRQLWEHGLVSRLLSDGSISGRLAGLLACWPAGCDRNTGGHGGLCAAGAGAGRRQTPRPPLH